MAKETESKSHAEESRLAKRGGGLGPVSAQTTGAGPGRAVRVVSTPNPRLGVNERNRDFARVIRNHSPTHAIE
jgi:hypothetical protein